MIIIRRSFFKKHRIIQDKENELKHKNEILDNLKNDNEIKKFENIKEAVIKINKKDPIMDIEIRDISDELNNTVEGSGQSVLEINSGDINFNLKCIVKMTEFTPISGGNMTELNKIPELFCNKKSLLILKNNDNKCFLYCYIRKFLNPITKNRFRITKRDKEIADKIINETNLTFKSVSINEMNEIEKN